MQILQEARWDTLYLGFLWGGVNQHLWIIQLDYLLRNQFSSSQVDQEAESPSAEGYQSPMSSSYLLCTLFISLMYPYKSGSLAMVSDIQLHKKAEGAGGWTSRPWEHPQHAEVAKGCEDPSDGDYLGEAHWGLAGISSCTTLVLMSTWLMIMILEIKTYDKVREWG